MRPMAANAVTIRLRANMSVLQRGLRFGCQAWAQRSWLKTACNGRSIEVLICFIAVTFWNVRHVAGRSDRQSRQTAPPEDSHGGCPIVQHGEGGAESRCHTSRRVEGDRGARTHPWCAAV